MRFSQASEQDLWRQIRRRILRETGIFLTAGLQRPELAVSIPVIPAGKGRFSKTFAREFWAQVLQE